MSLENKKIKIIFLVLILISSARKRMEMYFSV